jgi:hypothetical protein
MMAKPIAMATAPMMTSMRIDRRWLCSISRNNSSASMRGTLPMRRVVAPPSMTASQAATGAS